jgi:opacity protein-like surface antigen
MIRSRHAILARALSASVAAGALMLAASGGAGAQSAAQEKPASTTKKQAADARKQKPAPALAPGPYAMVTKGPALPSVLPAWEGLYGGVSFGAVQIRAGTSTSSREIDTTTSNFFPGIQTENSIADAASRGSGRNWGALSDIYLGYNFRLDGNVIVGVQVEGTMANAQAQLGVVRATSSNTTTVTTPPGSTSSSSSLNTSTSFDSLAERWAASALARIGMLIDPRDLIYVIGGYTYGGFEWNGRTFGLNGATVGGGWERQIAPGWTFKAEYRYTAFEDKDLPRSTSAVTTAAVTLGPPETDVATSTTTATDRVSGITLHALRLGLTHYFAAGEPVVGAYAMTTKAPPLLPAPWEGAYGGVSYGPASIRATTSSVSRQVTTSTTNNANGSVTASTSTADTLINGSGRNLGALSDVYFGYNFRPGGNVIAGVQVEGTIAEAQAQLTDARVQTTNATAVTTPPGSTTTTSSVGRFNGGLGDGIAERWAASALGRLGVLLDPRDLIYVVGGYTYGGFEWGARTFGLNGATAGAGWEREVAPGWTLKAEYRYTAFQDKDIASSTSSAGSQRNVSTTGAVTTSASSGTVTATDHVSGLALHALRFGITHYLNAPAPGAYAMVTKAPPPAAAPWTGLYGGVSFGLTSMHAHTDSTLTQAAPFGATSLTVTQDFNQVSETSGRHGGAVADIFLGYNTSLAPKVIAGVQAEGSIAHAQTLEDGTSVLTFTRGNALGASVATTTETTTFFVQSRWMASALARLGYLVDPRDLIYAIGGWSYGGFTTFDRVFELNGPTVGAGIEREVAPSWTIRAEYRYTHFLPRDVPTGSIGSFNQTTNGAQTFVQTFNTSETDRINGNLHAVRFGIAHYFDAR